MTQAATIQPVTAAAKPSAGIGHSLQRKCACGAGVSALTGECADCGRKRTLGLQTKLRIGDARDPYEQEADRIAEQVTAASALPPLGRSAPSVQRRGDPAASADAAPASVDRALADPGEPLAPDLRQDMERHFGHDFSQVRVHTGWTAAQSARDVRAVAYAVGHHIVFDTGRFAPATGVGRRLIAHELTHVVQQGAGRVLQRAEVEDKESVCKGLTDIRADVNDFVNAVLSDKRSVPGVSPFSAFFEQVFKATGGTGAVGPIEEFVEKLPKSKRSLPPASLAGTRYSSLPGASGLAIPSVMGRNIYDAHKSRLARVVGPAARINGICVGADKLGHFFQQGGQYAVIAEQSGLADAESFGRATEIDRAGLGATGVYSNADLAANRAGLRFWQELQRDPSGLAFDIANYISFVWNEYANPNYYEPTIAKEVWAKQLTGSWSGIFELSASRQKVDVHLSATTSGKVRGTFKFRAPAPPSSATGTIEGIIVFLTTAVSGSIASSVLHGGSGAHSASPVSGIQVEFDWKSSDDRGKGKWEAVGETMLVGDFGRGASATGGGSFNIVRR